LGIPFGNHDYLPGRSVIQFFFCFLAETEVLNQRIRFYPSTFCSVICPTEARGCLLHDDSIFKERLEFFDD